MNGNWSTLSASHSAAAVCLRFVITNGSDTGPDSTFKNMDHFLWVVWASHHALPLTGSVYMGPAPVWLCPNERQITVLGFYNLAAADSDNARCELQWCSTKANTYPNIIVILNKLGVSKQASLQHGLEEGQVDHVEKQQPQNGEVHNDGNLHVQKDCLFKMCTIQIQRTQ